MKSVEMSPKIVSQIEEMKYKLSSVHKQIFQDLLVYGIAFYHKPTNSLLNPLTMQKFYIGGWIQNIEGLSSIAIPTDDLFIIQHR